MSDRHDSDLHGHNDEPFQERLLSPAQNRDRDFRVKALEGLLAEKEFISDQSLDSVLDAYQNDIGPLNGSRVVARAWTDPQFKARLLENGSETIAELGFGGLQGEHLIVVENTPRVHNAIVCALCSCYPWPVLGLPPFWYKSQSYRSRIMGQPREVLAEFGLELGEDTEIKVWNADFRTRYMVLPERPSGTEHMSEEELVEIITRDSMIGVARVEPDKKETPGLSQRQVSDMDGTTALPRKSGELLFHDPWEGEAFAMAVSLCEQGCYDWIEFQAQLIQQVAIADQQDPESRATYYESWLRAFEKLLQAKGILERKTISKRVKNMKRADYMRRTRLPIHMVPWMGDDDDEDDDF